MATNEKIKKSYSSLGKQEDLFTIRTMKGDIERLRQGLPLKETSYASSTPPQFTPSRRLASDISEHNPSELPSQEVHQPIGVSSPAIRPPAYTPPAGGVTQRPTLPLYTAAPYAGSATLPVREPQPIETFQPKAQPFMPTQPRTGAIETVVSIEELTGERETLEKIITFLRRVFSSQKRVIVGISAALCLLVAGAYALLAAFGRPLPGWQFVFPSSQPSPQATATAIPTRAPTPSVSVPPSQTPTPILLPKTTYLPMRRIGIVEFTKDATQLDAIEKLTNIAFIAGQTPGDFTQLMMRHKENNADFTLGEFSSLLNISVPEELLAELTGIPTIFFYAPRDAKPASNERGGTLAPAHIGMIVPVSGSVEKSREVLQRWEGTLGGDIVPLALGREWQPGSEVLFQSNTFQGTHIRFQNFPDPYLAADYAVFEGSEPPLFMLTTSRESMFTVIGTLNYRSE